MGHLKRIFVTCSLLVCVLVVSGCPNNKESKYPIVSDTRWVVPSRSLPSEVSARASNNNVAIEMYDGRLYMGWRTAPFHFAHPDAKLYIVSSGDFGKTWTFETEISMKTDLREPAFLVLNNQLQFFFVELGDQPAEFTPKFTYRILKTENGWTQPEVVTDFEEGTIPWEMKVRNGVAWATAYKGNHYSTTEDSNLEVYFKKSEDGKTWVDVDPANKVIYRGGVSEVGFEFDAKGNIWGVMRNEDGDKSGFGSHLSFAKAAEPGRWVTPKKSNRYRYDSPRMLRVGSEIYLIARRNIVYIDQKKERFIEWPYDLLTPFENIANTRMAYLAAYGLLPKRTSVYKIDQKNKKIVWLKDLPSASDTSFPSIVQIGPKKFLLANYSTPLIKDSKRDINTRRWTWLQGQLSVNIGSHIYLTTLDF